LPSSEATSRKTNPTPSCSLLPHSTESTVARTMLVVFSHHLPPGTGAFCGVLAAKWACPLLGSRITYRKRGLGRDRRWTPISVLQFKCHTPQSRATPEFRRHAACNRHPRRIRSPIAVPSRAQALRSRTPADARRRNTDGPCPDAPRNRLDRTAQAWYRNTTAEKEAWAGSNVKRDKRNAAIAAKVRR